MNHAHRSPACRYGGKCSEAMLALRALHVEKGLRLGEVRRAIEAIADDVERAAASERAVRIGTKEFGPEHREVRAAL